MIGAYIGLNLGIKRRRLHIRKDGAQSSLSISIQETWSKSLMAFGGMNIVALLHHCIIPPPATYEDGFSDMRYIDTILWAADCIFTGLSSTQLIGIAWLVFSCCTKKLGVNEEMAVLKNYSSIMRGILASVLATAYIIPILIQLFYNEKIDIWRSACTSIEFIYFLPLGMGTALLFPFVFASAINAFEVCKNSLKSISGSQVAVLGGIIPVVGVALDATLCYTVTEYVPSIKTSPFFYDVYHTPTLVFIGCDIAFLGLDMWVDALTSELIAKKD